MYRSYEENEARKQGYRDSEQGRRDYYHSQHAFDGVDRAYWDGRKEQERDENRREEEREQERQAEEAEMRRHQERMREEEEYNIYLQSQIEDQMREERLFNDAMAKGLIHPDFIAPEYDRDPDFEDEKPITEQELFMRIQEDERENSI